MIETVVDNNYSLLGLSSHFCYEKETTFAHRMVRKRINGSEVPVPTSKPAHVNATAAKGDKKSLSTAALDSSLAYSLRRAQLSTYGGFLDAMLELDIRPAQYAVLVLIRTNPGCTQSSVSEALSIQKANFVALLDKLEKRGFTERRRVPGDRRSSALFLTPAGEAHLKRAEKAHATFEKNLTKRLGNASSTRLIQLLHKFSEKA
jgi:DNA-binding MarR family transcriptional regulator